MQQLVLERLLWESLHISSREALRSLPAEDAAANQTQDCMLERSGFSVRVADSSGQRSKASMLIERMYS